MNQFFCSLYIKFLSLLINILDVSRHVAAMKLQSGLGFQVPPIEGSQSQW